MFWIFFFVFFDVILDLLLYLYFVRPMFCLSMFCHRPENYFMRILFIIGDPF